MSTISEIWLLLEIFDAQKYKNSFQEFDKEAHWSLIKELLIQVCPLSIGLNQAVLDFA